VRVISGREYDFDQPGPMAAAGSDIFVANIWANGVEGSLTELDASTGALVSVISGPQYEFGFVSALVTDGTRLWVASEAGNSLTELGPVGSLVPLESPAVSLGAWRWAATASVPRVGVLTPHGPLIRLEPRFQITWSRPSAVRARPSSKPTWSTLFVPPLIWAHTALAGSAAAFAAAVSRLSAPTARWLVARDVEFPAAARAVASGGHEPACVNGNYRNSRKSWRTGGRNLW